MRGLGQFSILTALLASLALGGCSYHPLYAKPDSSGGVVSQLADVGVPEQGTRAGQLVRNDLLSGMATGQRKYALKMVVTEKKDLTSSLAKNVVDRYRYRLTVSYSLVEVGTGRELNSGKTFSDVAYDTVREPVADVQAAENARERAAKEVAQDLRLRISAYFSVRAS